MFVHMWLQASRYADVATAFSRLGATLTGHLWLTPLHTHHSKHLLDRAPLSPLIEPFLQARGYEIRSCFV
jgi:Tfp pilus assembly pilus retraction ATPase PilT